LLPRSYNPKNEATSRIKAGTISFTLLSRILKLKDLYQLFVCVLSVFIIINNATRSNVPLYGFCSFNKKSFMKAILICVAVLTWTSSYSQQTSTSSKSKTKSTNTTSASKAVSKQTGQANSQTIRSTQNVSTPTNLGQRPLNNANATSSNAAKSPFVGGIHAAPNADKPLHNAGSNTATNATNPNNNTNHGVSIAGGNDTTFNANTINQGGVTTNSGAVDRSGQSQFGQTNWGRNNRNTVGESQWTVPPPITSSFNKQFPGANSVEWQRNNVDTTQYVARYNFGGTWVSTTYNQGGEKLSTRTEIPLVQAPRPVSVYLAKQPSTFRIATISRLQLQGKPQVYEIKTSTGKTIYINDDGMETEL
jgi:hypothetical protein